MRCMIYIAESKTTVKQTCACPENATAVYDIIRQNKYPKYDGRLLQNIALIRTEIVRSIRASRYMCDDVRMIICREAL
jgi:hypothetical protein